VAVAHAIKDLKFRRNMQVLTAQTNSNAIQNVKDFILISGHGRVIITRYVSQS
jgi:hypothetical protein